MADRSAEIIDERSERARRRAGLAAVLVGNGLEFYDFLTFAFFVPQISRAFFPGQSDQDKLLLTLATFGAGFLTRPIGGILLGRYADSHGRRPALMISFALMGLAIAGVGLTPSYAAIGIAAPLLVLLFRLIQGFALGGDVGAATAYMIECAPTDRRGLYVSMQYVTQEGADLVAGLIGAGLAATLAPAALDGWGWRLPFLLGACIVPIGLRLRSRLHETLPRTASGAALPRAPIGDYWRFAAIGFLLLSSTTVSTYGKLYMTTYAETVLHMQLTSAFGATVALGAAGVAGTIVAGLLSDRIGRKPVILAAGALLLFAILPGFMLLQRYPTTAVLLAVSALISFLQATMTAPALVAITEMLPASVRAGALAIIYAFAIAIFGGSTQFMLAWLTRLTGSPLAPAWYMTGAVMVSLAALLLLAESAPRVLRARRIAGMQAAA